MHRVVRTFKTRVVEARFASFIVSMCVVAMRYGLFVRRGIPEITFPDTGFLWKYIGAWFQHPWVSVASSTLSVFIIAWLLSAINNRFTLIRARTNLPFIVPFIVFSIHPYFLSMSADYISIILILYAFIPLLSSYQQSNTQLFSFRISILIGLAALFQVYALLVLPLWLYGEYSMRGGHFKSFLASLFGLILVFWSAFVLYYFTNNIADFIFPFYYVSDISLLKIPPLSVYEWVLTSLTLFLFASFMVLSMRTYIRDKVITLVSIQFMIFMLIFLLLFQFVYWNNTLFLLLLSLALLSYLIAYFYTMVAKKGYIYSAYFLAVLLVVFYFINYWEISF